MKRKRPKTRKTKSSRNDRSGHATYNKSFLGGRMSDKAENDNMLSKHNYGSRKGCLTEAELLENIKCLFTLTKEKKKIRAQHQILRLAVIDRCLSHVD